MGAEKDTLVDQEESWSNKARTEDLRCSICSMLIPYGDRGMFFKKELRGYCANHEAKND